MQQKQPSSSEKFFYPIYRDALDLNEKEISHKHENKDIYRE